MTTIQDRIRAVIDMIDNCAGVPREPDSLPMMVLHELRILADSMTVSEDVGDIARACRGAALPEAAAALETLSARVGELESENNLFRAASGNNDKPCIYCGLDATEIVKCPDGFPGCGRMDDKMLCPHFALELNQAERADTLEAENKRLLNIIGVARCPSDGRHFVAECIQSTCGCSIGFVLNDIKEAARSNV